jgi:predicted DNA-binding protein
VLEQCSSEDLNEVERKYILKLQKDDYNVVRLNGRTISRRNDSDCLTTVRLPDDLREQLKAHAAELDRSVSWIIRQAILEYLTRTIRRMERGDVEVGGPVQVAVEMMLERYRIQEKDDDQA